MEIPVWVVLLIIFGAIAASLCCLTCCVVRCFRPQNTRGPEWYHRRDGKKQLVQSAFRNDRVEGDDGKKWLRVVGSDPAASVPALTLIVALP